MAKRKRRKQRRSRPDRGSRLRRQPSVDLQAAFSQADTLIGRGRAQEAVDLLEPLLASYPRVADLHYYIGYARLKAGNAWGGVAGYEQAVKLSRDPSYWLPLASLYLELEMNAHALHAFRQMQRRGIEGPGDGDASKVIIFLEQIIQETADGLGLPVTQVEKGLRFLEDGNRALQGGDFSACIAANRQAIKFLADWPPPHNNLSLALFFDGQPEQAIAAARQVLSQDPANVQALGNAIRFLAWSGQEAEARELWSRAKKVTPQDASDCLKMAEAAAILEQDEQVYELLKPLDRADAAQEVAPGLREQLQFLLAVAEANLGKRAAHRRLRRLQTGMPRAGELLSALKAGKPGPGWAERFPYFRSTELVAGQQMAEFVELVERKDRMSHRRFRRQVERFVERFPQLVLIAEKLIWEEGHPEAGIAFLTLIANPAAYAALRRFSLSQAGDDDMRMQALAVLSEAGEISPDETLRIWHQGQWREVQMRQYEISGEPEVEYSQQVADLLNEGLNALKRGDERQAERLFRRALKLEPRAKEGYNNLGTLYNQRGDHARAKEMFQAAVEIDPLYAFPRCNLAAYLLGDEDVEGAKAMLAPLADAMHFHPQEAAFYFFTQARIAVREEKYEAARNALRMTLDIMPEYEPAQELLERLDLITRMQTGMSSYFERMHDRDRAWRARLQNKLSTPEPSLSEALPLYTKDALTGMGDVVLLWGGWSGLRKAELIERLIGELTDPDNVARMVADLSDEEREALRRVLAQGGHMPWQEFDAEYGNDLEESRYWNWHEPETTMGRLRLRGLLVETTVEGELLIAVPLELRPILEEMPV